MRALIRTGALLGLLSVSSLTQAQGPSTCLTDVEARGLFTFAMPEALEGMATKCRAALPETAFLSVHSKEMLMRFRAAAAGSWPQAKAAFLKMSHEGEDDHVMASMPDSALQPFVAAAFSGVVANDVKPADCPKIDRFVAALAPLPPASVAELITALIALVGGDESDDLRIC